MRSKAILSFAVLASLSPAAMAEPKIMTWNVDGVTREAIVYLPTAKTANGKAPLVLAFHGHGDDARNFQGVGIHELWPQAIVAYPEGLPSPRDGAAGWQVEKGEDGDRDLKLIDQMVAGLRKQYRVDDARILIRRVSSNGANLTYLLWAERPQVFAAFAPVAARIRPSVHFTTPKPLFHTGGTADRQIPFVDQQAAMESARRANGATGKGESCGAQCTLYTSDSSGGKAGAPVMTLIHSGGHVYPEQVSQMIVDFFGKHALAHTSGQQHDRVAREGELVAEFVGITFTCEIYSPGWRRARGISKLNGATPGRLAASLLTRTGCDVKALRAPLQQLDTRVDVGRFLIGIDAGVVNFEIRVQRLILAEDARDAGDQLLAVLDQGVAGEQFLVIVGRAHRGGHRFPLTA